MSAAAERVKIFRQLLTHARERFGLDIGFVLWDGSTVPEILAPDAFAITFADEGAIAALIRRPKIETLANLWVAARIDLRNGSLFDLVARRPTVRTRELRKTLDKPLLIRTLAKFLLVPRGGPWPLEQIHGEKARSGNEAANKENIQYHYDVSNAFYALFLDPQMVYSCGYFTDWSNDIATAQRDKLDMICRKLRLKPDDAFLDIGCGWGALVCHAAQHYGVRAHGVTLAENQYAWAKEKAAKLGLQDRVTIELKDYTRLQGNFDKIASIGMFEHVGLANHRTYFQTINRLLAPQGLYLHHAITRSAKANERGFRRKRAEAVALARYIFPGGELDHIGMTAANLESGGFEVHDVEAWREHYARTCRLWHDRLLANREAAEREVGRDKTRLWLAYLAAVSIAFERNTARIFQTLASKRRKGPSGLPPTRADLYR
ncbi:MAG TPA: cyclopropane-fatty-acyl-phospholipid synthase family protein [Xanthobacteraceae bacterium]|nr:cyclopropane-fatty-acyl-phospholipid synthase family protein [Xanthobacteraceae bacterium]